MNQDKYTLPDGNTDWRQMLVDEQLWDYRLKSVPVDVVREMVEEIEKLRGSSITPSDSIALKAANEELIHLRNRVRIQMDLVSEAVKLLDGHYNRKPMSKETIDKNLTTPGLSILDLVRKVELYHGIKDL